MKRSGQVAQQLGLLARTLTTSSLASSVPATQTVGGGLFTFMSRKTNMPPMNVSLGGVDPISPAPVPATPPATEVTKLSNGIRVAAQNTMSPMATVGIVVESGSIYEDVYSAGASQLIEAMAFKGTANRSHLAIVRQAENYGITFNAIAARESTAYYATVPRDSVAAAMEILCDNVLHPRFTDHVLAQEKARLAEANNSVIQDPAFMASEGIVSAAYSGALARPAFWQGAPITADTLTQFHDAFFTTGNMTVAAAGAPLATVQALAQEFLGGAPTKPAPPVMPSTYVGGSASEHISTGATALVAFETSGWKDIETAIMTTVVQYLLGGGSDFSSGGPGKGMHSRLYQSVLTRKPWVTQCTAYTNVFENTGLAGILMATPDPYKAEELVNTLCQELESLARGVSGAEVARAKNACESQVHAALELPTIVAEDIARQLVSYGRRVPLDEFKAKLQAVDAAGVQKYAQKLLSGKPSAVLLGDQAVMPKFGTIEARFG